MWQPAEKVAKNDKGDFVAFIGNEWVPVEKAAQGDGGYMVFRGGERKPADPMMAGPAGVAAEMPEWERRAAGVGQSMLAIPEALKELLGGKGAREDVASNKAAMQALEKASAKETAGYPEIPLWARASPIYGTLHTLMHADAEKLKTAADITQAAMMRNPVPQLGPLAGGAVAGGIQSLLTPTGTGGDAAQFAAEKAKQTGTGAAIGGALSKGFDLGVKGFSAGRDWLRNLMTPGKPLPEAPSGEKVMEQLRARREGVEEGIGRRAERGQERLESARAATAGERTATPGEFGATVRGTMEARKTGIEAKLEEATEPLRREALESGERVNITGIPKQIDEMLRFERNPDTRKLLRRVKEEILQREGGGPSQEELAAQIKRVTPGSPEYHELVRKLREPKAEGPSLIDDMRSADSARLALKEWISDEKNAFAKTQLIQVQSMLEQAMGGKEGARTAYGRYLDTYRQMARELDPYSAQTGAGARTAGALQRDAFGKEFMSAPEAMGGRFFKPGDIGAAAAREFKTAIGDDPQALQAMEGYVFGKLKDVPADQWGKFIQKHESALKELGLFDKFSGYERAASEAAKLAKQSAASAKKATGTLESSPVGKITREPTMGHDARMKLEGVLSSGSTADLNQIVKTVRQNPEALSEMREVAANWMIARKPTGEINPTQILRNWEKMRQPAIDSGLIDAAHAANIDKAMESVKKAASSEGIKSTAGAGIGGLAGLIVGKPGTGAMFGRQVGRIFGKQASTDAQNAMVEMMMGDPKAAQLLAAEPTAANVKAAADYFRQQGQREIADAIAGAAGRESADRKPNPLGMRPTGL